MANVRYSKGGTAATLGTKTIDENGVYNASDDSLDGYSQVTVDVPEPEGSVTLTYDHNGTYSEDIKDYAYADVTVNVPIPTVNTQTKTITATTSQQTVTPDPGYLLEQVTVNPQQNTGTYTPVSNTASNDMGPINNYRYVNTAGMILPTGTKEVSYDSNGTYTESVTNYENIEIDIDVPVGGTLGTKNIITNGTYTALDDDVDGYSEVTVNVPQNATLGIKSITANGSYNAITDGYDGFSRVDVSVSGAVLQASKTVTATTSQQTVTPDVGYDGMEQVIVDPQVHTQTYTPAANTAANDMGAQNNYRYVDTSGMYTPSSITPSNSTPAQMTANTPVNPTANGYAIESYYNLTPSNTPAIINNDRIYKPSDNGFAISEFYPLTPSDSTPPLLTSGTFYKPSANGYLYATQQTTPTSITPSNSTPVTLSADTPVNPTASGYAISSYSSKTPSDSSPASVSSGDIIKASASGYLYASSGLGKCKAGTFTSSTSAQTITLGFKPKYLLVMTDGRTSNIYNESYSSSQAVYAATNSYSTNYTISGNSSNNRISAISSTGFTYNRSGSAGSTIYYFAVG